MVYLWKKNGRVFHHTDRAAAVQLDGLSAAPDMQVSEADFEAAGGMVRLVDNEIFLGKTEAEIQAEANERRIVELKRNLAATDYIAAKIAEYAGKIAQRQAWRQEIDVRSA